MADQPKKKSSIGRNQNDERPNRKAWKKEGATRNSATPLTELQKALLGGGALKRITKPIPGSIPGRWR